MPKKIRFTARDREIIRKHSIGKPTGVVVEVGGMEIDLVPLTTEQAGEVFAILDAFATLQKAADDKGAVESGAAALGELVGKEGARVKRILHGILHESATAGDLIDDEAVFEEWFNRLPLLDTVKVMLPKIIEAQGLGTMLGNSLTPPSEAATAGNTNP